MSPPADTPAWPAPLVEAARLGSMLEPTRTALVVIDVQRDFVAADGALGQAGVDMAPLQAPLARIERLIAAARAAAVTVALARVVTERATDSRALRLFYARQGLPPEALELCRAGTPGVDYYRIAPATGDIEVRKPLYSSFHGTDFETQLRARGIDTLVVCGFSTECCVDCTVRDAFHRDFSVFVVADASAAYEPALHLSTLDALARNCALLVDTAAVLQVWQAGS
ncbi:cysteine hydrolase family protein [Pseudoxanthomonas winnipegensis]|nr:isochorismatase family cysteine hydrolase [Pseudoxanthomonas winnipegensis]